MQEVAIGIDIGGTYTKYGIVEPSGKMLADGHIATESHKGVADFLTRLHKEILGRVAQLDHPVEIVGIGIGAPNANYHKGTIEYPANLPWEGVTPFIRLFQEKIDVPMLITNDANAASVGEMLYGAAKGLDDFVLLTLGTGLGSGFVANGETINGHDGLAAELGHTFVIPDGRDCGCGGKGCLETYVSATGIRRTVFELMANTMVPSTLKDVPFNEMTSYMIAQAAKEGDPLALKAFEFTGKVLGKALANTVAYLSPKAIFLWGGLAKAGDLLFKPTKAHMEANLMTVYKNKVEILPSGLQDANIAVLGAAAMIWKEMEKKSRDISTANP